MRRTVQESFDPREFSSIEDFTTTFQTDFPSGGISVSDSLPLHLKWFNRNSDTTFVTFSAAITRRAATEVPVFSGWSTTKHLSANVLMISDPSLILDTGLNLGWYAGSAEQPGLSHVLTDVLSVFARDTRLVLFGASGGGFAALAQASRLPGSTALVSNPQTDITRFSYYPEYVRLAWPGHEHAPVQTEVVTAYSQPVDCSVIYVQNAEDTDHVVNHLGPFQEACHPGNQITVLTPALSEGHIGPAPDSFKEIFSTVCEHTEFDQLSAAVSRLNIYSTRTDPRD